MSIIKINNLNFSYYGYTDDIFKNLNIEFDTNWKMAIIGKNGCGKSTFLKLLAGELNYSGNISKSEDFVKFPVEIKDREKFAIDIFDEKFSYIEQWKLFREMNLLELDSLILYRPFSTLSKGEQTKVMFAMIFSDDERCMLLDEPTNHLDADGRRKISKYLNGKKGFLMISHDRNFIDSCTDHIISIQRGEIEIQSGNFSSWYENNLKKEKYEMAESEKLKKDIKRLKSASLETKNWSDKVEMTKNGVRNSGSKVDKGFIGHRSAKMMKRSKVLEKRQEEAIEKKQEMLKNFDKKEDLKLKNLNYHKDLLIEVKNFSYSYEENTVINNLSFELKKGERLLLRGKNGCGKSTLIKALTGQKKDYTGEIKLPEDIVISYIRQDSSNISGSLEEYINKNNSDQTLCRSILRKLGFSRESFDMDMQNYSDGQKKKVEIAISLSKKAHVFIWDEPLNYIDLISRIQIEEIITSYKPTMIFVEHDEEFCKKAATRVINL